MKYSQPTPRTRAEIEADLNSSDAAVVASALTSAALHDADRQYVESLIIKFLQHDDAWVRGVSAIAAGHVARIHLALSTDRIVPLIEALLQDPRTSGKAQDSLDDINMFLGGGNAVEGQ